MRLILITRNIQKYILNIEENVYVSREILQIGDIEKCSEDEFYHTEQTKENSI
jgi:hypothetical protein